MIEANAIEIRQSNNLLSLHVWQILQSQFQFIRHNFFFEIANQTHSEL